MKSTNLDGRFYCFLTGQLFPTVYIVANFGYLYPLALSFLNTDSYPLSVTIHTSARIPVSFFAPNVVFPIPPSCSTSISVRSYNRHSPAIVMGRGKGSFSRKESGAQPTMVGRRPAMELISPIFPLSSKRSAASDPTLPPLPQSHKRSIHSRQSNDQPLPKRQRTPHFSSLSISPLLTSLVSEQTADLPHAKVPQPYPHPPMPNQPTIPNFLYAPFRTLDLDKVFRSPDETKALAKVHIAVEHLTAENPAIRMRNLWGSGRYTDDSDLVAVLLHTGMYSVTLDPPKTFQYLSVLIQLEKHVNGVSEAYPLAKVKGFTSRSWGAKYEGASLTVQSVAMVSLETAMIPPRRNRRKTTVRPHRLIAWNQSTPKKPHANAAASSSAMAAYARDGKLEAKQAVVSGTMSFDMVNEPCLVYDIKEVASLRHPKSIFDRLRNETLYVEDGSRRFEIAITEPPSSKSSARNAGPNEDSCVRFAEVPEETLQKLRLQNAGLHFDDEAAGLDLDVPLAVNDLKIIAKKIPWTELVWDSKGVTVQGVWYELTRLCFRKRTTGY